MKTLSLKFAAVLSVLSLSTVNYYLKASAEVYDFATLRTARVCNTIMNMQNADPHNLDLIMARKECNLRNYYVQVCESSGKSLKLCQRDNYNDSNEYGQPPKFTTAQLEDIIEKNL
ncbi:hypothetical protein Sta7437_3454 [Stanieria cyanosphaera PCC 7437]|uniref:Uncharacterized protein n=1 Tax=Stanieria cyanosphaera (strain ATCC 29371 / PCC 7437) TaxID=111780 RepID=K9XWI6_STAC7|nr:hypothetical protein [Stanieria cyanosphaera]AFZ36955.1 hypothetical protein Sta7437_3454 [Stanieria cyanosphaera PCC 7437]